MKNIFPIIKLTILTVVLFAVIYPLAIYGLAQLAPNNGKGETLALNDKVVGYRRIGQKFSHTEYFWGRPSAVDYNAAGSAGSNKGPSNAEYLAVVQQRIDTFLIAHPCLVKTDIPSDMVTASGSGMDPDISVQGAKIQARRIANTRKKEEKEIIELIASKIEKPLFGPEKINILQLNIALDKLK